MMSKRSRRSTGFCISLSFLILIIWGSFAFDPFITGEAGPAGLTNLDSIGTTIYLPIVLVPEGEFSTLEVTQTVQQPGNPVTLIAERPTYVRYTLISETAYSGVNAYLHGSRDGIPLPGSPLSAMNNPRTLEPIANRADLNDAFNFIVPSSWTTGTVSLWGSASNDTTYDVVEDPISVTFTPNDPLAVTVVPIAYTCTSGGTGTVTPPAPFDYLVEDAYKLYPVPSTDLEVHLPVSYSGPCFDGQPYPDYDALDWHNMLDSIRVVWILEDSPNRYYYGLVNIYCGGSCIAGLGHVGGYKAAVGWNGSGVDHKAEASATNAHEVGHNHGLLHAPGCGASGVDGEFPYTIPVGTDTRGVIGNSSNPNYGVEFPPLSIKTYNYPYYDFMSYCSPEWISDYNYEKLYDWEQTQAAVAPELVGAPMDALLISGTVSADGSVEIRPAFRLEITEAPSQSGPYTLELLDSAGARLSTHSFQLFTASADSIGGAVGGDVQGFHLTIPYTPEIDQIRVVKDEDVLGERRSDHVGADLALAPAQAHLEGGILHASWAGPAGASYLVRLSLDGGTTWQTVGVNLDRPSIHLQLSAAAAGDVRLVILASDGIHTDRIEMRPITTVR